MLTGQMDCVWPLERHKMEVRKVCEWVGDDHRARNGRMHRKGRLVELRRRKFVISHSLTTLAVSLLIWTCMILEVRPDSQPSFRKVFSTEPLGDPNAAVQHGSSEHGSADSNATSAPNSAPSTTSAPTSPVGGRQPRATTRRRNTSTTTTTGSGAGASSTLSPAQTETELPITLAPKPLVGARTISVPNKKLTLEEEAEQDEADAAAEAEEAERAAARRRRLRNRKRPISGPSSSVSPPIEPLTTTTNNPVPSISTTARAPSSRGPSATSRRPTGASSGNSSSSTTKTSTSTTSTLGGRHVSRNHSHHSHLNSSDGDLDLHDEGAAYIDDDLDYDEEFTASSRPPGTRTTRRKTIDLDRVKLVDASHSNATLAESKKKTTQDGSHANETTTAPEDGTLAPVELHGDRDSSDPLDARSPGVAKRLTDIITETRGRLRSSSTPAPGSSTRHFSYSKPTSTTEMLPSSPTTLVATTPSSPQAGLIVQVMNQTASGEPTGGLVTLNETAAHLDWSKLVKVMFKSARDNQTIYTLVMNSSELSNHPISDWSNELPGLLRRDFEKLREKWLHVFPDLMSDLATIITRKHPTNVTLKSSSEAHQTRLPLLRLTPSTMQASNANVTTTITPQSTSPMSSLASNNTMAANATQPGQTTGFWPVASNSSQNSSMSTNQNTSITTVAVESSTVIAHQREISNSSAVVQSRQPNGSWTSDDGYGRVISDQSAMNQMQMGTGGMVQVRNVNGTQAGSAEGGITQNKTMDEMIQDIRDENRKIEDDVREQGSSLKHFIIICSISTVVATSLVVTLILLLLK